MYVGRIVSIARTQAGNVAGMYRVSSRSFPNRQANLLESSAAIVPKPGHENDIHKNPYIAYSCLMQVGTRLVVSNGSHTDPIAGKLSDGASPRDALASVLHGMDFEHDHLSTPRIAAIVDTADECGYLGIVRANELLVRCLPIGAGQAWYVATYEHTVPGDYADDSFDCASGDDACAYIMGRGAFADLERPITAACGVATGATSYDIAVRG
jgi:IMP cyclohydrolase